ncbi:unnamed protein product, partial [Musa banksii]
KLNSLDIAAPEGAQSLHCRGQRSGERAHPEDPLHHRNSNHMNKLSTNAKSKPSAAYEFCGQLTTAAPRLLAGLIPVPVIGIVPRWTVNTANPIGSGAMTCTACSSEALVGTHSWRRCSVAIGADRDVGVAGAALGVGGREDCVNEHEGADDLETESGDLGATCGHLVGSTDEGVVGVIHDPLDDSDAADSSHALQHHIVFGPQGLSPDNVQVPEVTELCPSEQERVEWT